MGKSENGKSESSILSRLLSLEAIVNLKARFNVPIYQRLYVWKDEQISTLLSSLYKSYIKNDDYFYLGGIIVVKNREERYDLIDGQQRFTTLWLIGYILGNRMDKFNYIKYGPRKESRLNFSIREFTNLFLDNPLRLDTFSDSEKEELLPLSSAIEVIKGFCDGKLNEHHRQLFSDYIYEKVWLVVNEVPIGTDENKLFEATNNRGEQLQQHQILKSRLLKYVRAEERGKYGIIWDACSLMDEYIEKNLKDISGKTWKQLKIIAGQSDTETSIPDDILNLLDNGDQEVDAHSLKAILENDVDDIFMDSRAVRTDLEYDSGKVRSIISFPMLLLHTLRIFLFEKEGKRPSEKIPPVDGSMVLGIFDEFFKPHFNRKDVTEFVKLLWKIRVKFDKHIIKWAKTENSELHVIKRLYLNKESLQRREPESNEGFALLQSMLYHSQEIITHYWLTPFLYKLLQTDRVRQLYTYLQKLDNAMFCTNRESELSVRSWKLMGKELDNIHPNIKYLHLDDTMGTKFPSYVFYKLDYVLWHMRDIIFSETGKTLDPEMREKWQSFRMTSRSSVEHISPQHPKEIDPNIVWEPGDSEYIKKQKQDDFGNLVLLAKGMNSEYSNKIFKVKREEFLAKPKIDSPKSSLIFINNKWNHKLCTDHRDEMKRYLQMYFSETK